jgi:tricorn protease
MEMASGESEVIYSGNDPCFPHFSPDGKWIAFTDLPEGSDKAEVYIIPASGGEPTKLTTYPRDPGLDTPGATYLSWSPDGQWIVYNLDLSELWKVSVQ